ncbi:Alpha/Beta hydrolase protein [Daldinia eschscholtzii]|nr:Alpha/Beta hydrolase protein [Daldinia eschscholtzii]
MAGNEKIPTTGNRTTLASSVKSFLDQHPQLRLGGNEDFHTERRHHLEVFGFHNLDKEKRAPIKHVHFDCIRGRHGTIPRETKLPALIYFHGGGYTVGSMDEFENGLRMLAEAADMITIGLDEYEDVLQWTRGPEGAKLGIDPERVLGGSDSAGGNMTAALCLRLQDSKQKQQPLKAQILLYPEARLPFDTPAAAENNSGYYLECNGIFSFADHYLPRAPDAAYPPSHRYISPGMQPVEKLSGLPPAAVFTCGFDPLRDVGVEYAAKLRKAGNQVTWCHYPDLTHGFLQMAPWSGEAERAVLEVARVMRELAK